jgi:hypothetical protein
MDDFTQYGALGDEGSVSEGSSLCLLARPAKHVKGREIERQESPTRLGAISGPEGENLARSPRSSRRD